jgi:hypothetical protein
MPAKRELSGKIFGDLIVIGEYGKDRHGAYTWLCKCKCGSYTAVRGSGLTQGRARTCGCGVKSAAQRARTHGQTNTPLYQRWQGMLARTMNSSHGHYHNYGGRGITVCDRWLRFENFSTDMKSTFSPELEIERRNVNGPYSPDNCCWATRVEQQRNRRNNHIVEWRGHQKTVQEWGEILGLKPNTIITRLRRNWSPDRALTQGVDHCRLLELANGK